MGWGWVLLNCPWFKAKIFAYPLLQNSFQNIFPIIFDNCDWNEYCLNIHVLRLKCLSTYDSRTFFSKICSAFIFSIYFVSKLDECGLRVTMDRYSNSLIHFFRVYVANRRSRCSGDLSDLSDSFLYWQTVEMQLSTFGQARRLLDSWYSVFFWESVRLSLS